MERRNITSFVALVFAFLITIFAPSSAYTSDPLEIGSCEDDQVCWSLFDENSGNEGELFEDSLLPGIDLTIAESGSVPNLNKYLKIGFDTSEVKTRTWGGSPTVSDFTWTFNAGDVDPSLKFASNNIYLQNGRLALNVETDPTENTACSLFVGDNVNSAYGVYQFAPGSKNYFKGNTAVGEEEPEAGIGLFVSKIFDTDASNYGEKISVSQDTLPSSPSNPGGLTCEFDYNASAATEFFVETNTANDYFTFTEGSTVVAADGIIAAGISENDWIKSENGTHWYVVTGLNPDNDPTEITIWPEFEETTEINVKAKGLNASYRMYAISGANKLTNGGDASSLRGVLGSVSVDSEGNVQSGIGTRGGVTMSDVDAWMGVGACLATYTRLDNGTLDNWYGLGIESPEVRRSTVGEDTYSAKITKEVVGVGIGSLLRLADAGSIGENCMAYGIKIKELDPYNRLFSTINAYGIYQEGDEQNYLGGALEVDGVVEINEYVDINHTSSVRAYLDDNNTASSSAWQLVEFDDESYDERNEFNTTSHEFTASLSGKYQINVCLFFMETECMSKIQIKVIKNPALSQNDYTMVTGYGYCNPRYPTVEDSASICFSNCIELNVGDELTVVYAAPDDIYIAAGEHQSYITIQKVS
jgi:hypothetical protein